MVITGIEINNVKGIEHLSINYNIQPNRPNILVAPNGFGKSSIATAFKNLREGALSLKKEDCYNENENNKPQLRISRSIDGTISADENHDTISENYNVYVVTSQLKPTAKAKHFAGRTMATASLDIEQTVVIKKIPSQIRFEYEIASARKFFGNSGRKLLKDISPVYNSAIVIKKIEEGIDFHVFDLAPYKKAMLKVVMQVNNMSGLPAVNIKNQFIENGYGNLGCPEFDLLCDRIGMYLELADDVEKFFCGWQYIYVKQKMKSAYQKALAYINFLNKKEILDKTIENINPVSDRFNIVSHIENNRLVINWPKAHQISSGQRDSLVFVAKLVECEFQTEGNCILVIDEIFDYLDDANLVAFQYYISSLIDYFRKNKRIIFPILLTHLDPNFLKHFCFDNKRLNVCYLKETKSKISKPMLRIVQERENTNVKDDLDTYFFHYHPESENKNFIDSFSQIGLNTAWASPSAFRKKTDRETRHLVIDNDQFDPLAVCFSVRVRIEEIVYNMLLRDDQKMDFIKVHGTTEKLNYAKEEGYSIPETYFLLGIVYNHPLHAADEELSKPLGMKLDNPTIKKMIRNLWQ